MQSALKKSDLITSCINPDLFMCYHFVTKKTCCSDIILHCLSSFYLKRRLRANQLKAAIVIDLFAQAFPLQTHIIALELKTGVHSNDTRGNLAAVSVGKLFVSHVCVHYHRLFLDKP